MTIPTAVTGLKYTGSELTGVWYRAKADDNHEASEAVCIPVAIGKASLTVTAKPKTISYGDEPANDGVTYSGFVNNETESVLGGTLAYGYTYEQYGDVGNYAITPKGLTSDNSDLTGVLLHFLLMAQHRLPRQRQQGL